MQWSRSPLLILLLAWALPCVPLGAQEEGSVQDAAEAALAILAAFDDLPYAERVDSSGAETHRGHLLALGAMQKVRGVWRPAASERHDVVRWSFTWRAREMLPSEELLEELVTGVRAVLPLEPVFSCDARACGSSAQWANRIFGQRLLYGTEASQRYRVFAANAGDRRLRLILYASARTSDRQYLHAELLELTDP